MTFCSTTLDHGFPCTMPRMRDSQYCFVHNQSPEVVARRRSARQRGGKMRRRFLPKPPEPTTLDSVEDIRDLMLKTVTELREGRLDVRSGAILAFAARTALRASALAEDRIDGDDWLNTFPLRFEIGALKELSRIAESARIRKDAVEYVALLRQYALRYYPAMLAEDGSVSSRRSARRSR